MASPTTKFLSVHGSDHGQVVVERSFEVEWTRRALRYSASARLPSAPFNDESSFRDDHRNAKQASRRTAAIKSGAAHRAGNCVTVEQPTATIRLATIGYPKRKAP